MTSSGDESETGPASQISEESGRVGFTFTPTDPPEFVAAVNAADWPRVIEMVESEWFSLVIGHLDTLFWMFRQVPREVVESHMLLKAGRDMMVVGPAAIIDEDRSILEPEAIAEFGQSPQAMQIVTMVTARAVMLRLSGFFQAARQIAEQARAIAGRAGRSHGNELVDMLPNFQLMWGITRQLADDLPGSLIDFDRAYNGNLHLGVALTARDASGKAALANALLGDSVEAALWSAREKAFPEPEGWLASTAPVAGHVAHAVVALDRLDLEAATVALAKVRSLIPTEEYWAVAAAASAWRGLLFGHPSEALQQLRDVREVHSGPLGDGISRNILLSTELELLVALGQGDRAARVLAESDLTNAELRVIRARLSLLAGSAEAALHSAKELLASNHPPRIRLRLMLIRASAHSQLGDDVAATDSLVAAVEVFNRYELASPFAGVARELLRSYTGQVRGLPAVIELLDRSGVREVYPERLHLTDLTPREFIVLRELAAHSSLAAISEKLFVSLATLKSQRYSLYRKLGVHSRTEALERAYERGLL